MLNLAYILASAIIIFILIKLLALMGTIAFYVLLVAGLLALVNYIFKHTRK